MGDKINFREADNIKVTIQYEVEFTKEEIMEEGYEDVSDIISNAEKSAVSGSGAHHYTAVGYLDDTSAEYQLLDDGEDEED